MSGRSERGRRRIQLDLHPSLTVDRILFEGAPLKYARELSAVYQFDVATDLYYIDVRKQ
jgi:hypothetical protein